jgi:hypothetical protein
MGRRKKGGMRGGGEGLARGRGEGRTGKRGMGGGKGGPRAGFRRQGPLGRAGHARGGWGEGGGGERPARKRWIAPISAFRGRARVALTEVSGSEADNEAVDAEAAHGLVAKAGAGGGVAAHDEPPLAHDLAVLVDGEHARPEWFAGAAREDAEVVRVLEANMGQGGREKGGGGPPAGFHRQGQQGRAGHARGGRGESATRRRARKRW